MADHVDDRLIARLTAALDDVPLAAPDPARARYHHLRPSGRLTAFRGPGLGLAVAVSAALVVLGLNGSLAQPSVWLQHAANSAQHLQETFVPAAEPARPTDTPEPATSPTAPAPAKLAPAVVQPHAAPSPKEEEDRPEAHSSPRPPSPAVPSPRSSEGPGEAGESGGR